MQNIASIFFVYSIIFYSQLIFINANPIVGHGVKKAKENEKQYTSVVCLLKMKGKTHIQLEKYVWCAGTLITYEHVITAEDCFYELGSSHIEVAVGSVDLYKTEIFYPRWWLTYDHWASSNNKSTNTMNGIAIMKIHDKVCYKFNNIVLPFISKLSDDKLTRLEGSMLGWGASNDGNYVHILIKAKLKIKAHKECTVILNSIQKSAKVKLIGLPQNMICTESTPVTHMTMGDIGGPLFYGDLLLAVNNGVGPMTGEFSEKKVNIHTDVKFYKQYIDDTSNQ